MITNCTAQVRATPCTIDRSKNYKTKELGIIYQQLREQRDACSNYGSGLHFVMDKLLDSLNTTGIAKDSIIKTMGHPDKECSIDSCVRYYIHNAKVHQSYKVNNKYEKVSDNYELLIYDWRSGHDYIRFYFNKDTLSYADWFFALD